jgi:hypothetical protein
MIQVSGKQIEVVRRGFEQAKQIAALSKWLSRYVAPVVTESVAMLDRENATAAAFTVLVNILSSVEPEALIELGCVITGEDEEFVKENFDLDWVIEGAMELMQQKALMRLLEPFFGRQA